MATVDFSRIDPKRRTVINHQKKQFVQPTFKQNDYKHRLNFYNIPPTEDVTLEEFEEWAIHRLKVLAELEACSFRNKGQDETEEYMKPILEKHLPLAQSTSRSTTQQQQQQRKKDHYSHFILRLAFSATEDLRQRFTRLETQLFRLRFRGTDARDRQEFLEGLDLGWEKASEQEKKELASELQAVNPNMKKADDEGWFKVDWENVPELVESRKVFLKHGKAYVPSHEQASMVASEFVRRLNQALELTARAVPRLDEDDRLSPILKHLSENFSTAGSTYDESEQVPGANITAASIDSVSQHFPLCMKNLHMTLRKNNHLKYFGRLQYTLFLKGIGLSMEDALLFWRQSFKMITDDQFNKEYRYNVRYAYGDVGGDSNRRGRGSTPFSCQKLLLEALPGPGQSHGCPYRTHAPDNLINLLQATGVNDRDLLKNVREDVGKQRYHVACNKVFDWAHRSEIQKVKENSSWDSNELATIVHPNEYFKRSYRLKNLDTPKQEIVMGDA